MPILNEKGEPIYFVSTKLRKSKWLAERDFMEDVINICPTCGKRFSMPDGTSVAQYYTYCPFVEIEWRKIDETYPLCNVWSQRLW